MVTTYTILSEGIVRFIHTHNNPIAVGSSYQELTKPQIMDLISSKKQVVERSRKTPDKTFFIDVDVEGECSIKTEFTKNQSLAAYKNGSEIALPEESKIEAAVKPKKSKMVVEAAPKNAPIAKEVNKLITKPTAGAVKPSKKMSTKEKSKPKKAVKKISVKKVARAKKILKPGENIYGPKVSGASKEMSIKDIRKLLKNGKIIRNDRGFYYSEKFLADRVDQDKKLSVHVADPKR